MTPLLRIVPMVVAAAATAACGKTPQPPDLVKSQRESMEKAKAVEQALQKGADQKRIDDGDQK